MMRRIAVVAAALSVSSALFGLGWLFGSGGDPWGFLLHIGGRPFGSRQRASAEDHTSVAAQPFGSVQATGTGEASVLLVGDLLPIQDRDYLTYARDLIASADYAIGNLECPLSAHGAPNRLKLNERGGLLADEYLFCARPSQAARLAATGFDALTLANNHIMDYGGEALLETIGELDAVGIEHTGAGPDLSAARKPSVAQVGGQTLAVLAYVSTRTVPGTRGFAATDRLAGTVFVDGTGQGEPSEVTRQMLQNDLTSARKQADFVVVAFHWGTEAKDTPDPLPRRLARLCIDAGADMVIGHHPHKLQGIEIYRGKPIAYSLGNFVFPTTWESNHFSAALEVRLRRGHWEELVLHPVRLRFRAGDPALAEGSDLARIVDRVVRLSEQLGTKAVYDDQGSSAVVRIENPSSKPPQMAILKAEEQHFYWESHPELDGMCTVHFLAWDLDGGSKTPRPLSVVTRSSLAREVLEILKEIYLSPERFPIHDVVGYNYRTVAGGSGLSNHALGRAIDINRAENPMIQGGRAVVHPDEPPYEPGEWQPGENPYSIAPDGPVVRAFRSQGWRWGGDWVSCRDYQHFDKPGA